MLVLFVSEPGTSLLIHPGLRWLHEGVGIPALPGLCLRWRRLRHRSLAHVDVETVPVSLCPYFQIGLRWHLCPARELWKPTTWVFSMIKEREERDFLCRAPTHFDLLRARLVSIRLLPFLTGLLSAAFIFYNRTAAEGWDQASAILGSS